MFKNVKKMSKNVKMFFKKKFEKKVKKSKKI